jgi:hypothetical protein
MFLPIDTLSLVPLTIPIKAEITMTQLRKAILGIAACTFMFSLAQLVAPAPVSACVPDQGCCNELLACCRGGCYYLGPNMSCPTGFGGYCHQ